MKKITYSAAIFCTGIFAGALREESFGQGSIPNGNFENWTSATYDYPQNYLYNTNPTSFFKCGGVFNVIKSTDAYHGTYSIQMTTTSGGTDTCFGAFVNANPDNNFPNWPGGFAYNQKPTGIRGYYKSAIASPDTGRMILIFKLGGNVIGTYIFPLYGTQSVYTLFDFPVSPALPSNPDTVIFAAASSDVTNDNSGVPGSMLKLDSVSFTGVTSQPALMNGSFELWQSQTIDSPDNWQVGSGDGQGFNRTNDAAAGNYAIELTTYLGDNNGVPRANSGNVSNGYWDNSCNCWKGGYPFTNQIDTLLFSYKYAPVNAGDSAWVGLTFKKNGINIWSTGKDLAASASYQAEQIPFNIGQAPDTVIVELQSSGWNDTLLASIGDVFKVDEIHFKSQPLNTSVPTFSIQNSISIYPNPSIGRFTVQSSLFNIQCIEVYNAIGEKVITQTLNSKSGTINVSDDGLYLVKMTSNGKTFTKKLIVEKP